MSSSYRICPLNAFGSASGGNCNINTSGTPYGASGQVKGSDKSRFRRRIRSNNRDNPYASGLCNSPSGSA